MLQTYNDTIASILQPDDVPKLQPVTLPHEAIWQQPTWINWSDRIEAMPTYSFADVVQGKIASEKLLNKIVIVGTTATGIDTLQTPFDQIPPVGGVYLHAAMLDNLLHDRLLQRLPEPPAMLAILSLGLLTSVVLSKLGLKGRIAVVVGLSCLWLAAGLAALSLANWWIPIAAPVGTVLMAGFGMQLREQHEKQLLMSLFAKHVAPETAAVLWQNRRQIFQQGELQAQELVATVLFMDIRGFTTISEKLPPQELLSWLNLYLEAMTDCIMDHDGVVDKYIGDSIMAVFGVPFSRKNLAEIQQDAFNAIAASLAMHNRLQSLNQQLQAEGKSLIQFGIGIHTGLLVAGSVGGARRLNYSVLGDVVNIASRLEGLNKEITANNPHNLLITAETLSLVHDRFLSQPVGKLKLRGRMQPKTIFSVLGQKPTNVQG